MAYMPRDEEYDTHFMRLVYDCASLSKDQSTHIGAVLTKDRTILSTGFNSFPRGINDDLPERQERPGKYFFFEHAERNAIYNAIGKELSGSTLYTNGVPCADCGRAAIQVGVKEVVVHLQFPRSGLNLSKTSEDQWTQSIQATLEMFKECGVHVRGINPFLGKETLFDGSIIQV